MDVFGQLALELLDVIKTIIFAIPYLATYVLLILLALFVWQLVSKGITPKRDFGSLKTVTFGDASAVASNSVASIVSIIAIVLLWGAFTGSKLVPSFVHMPGAFEGELTFTYEGEDGNGVIDSAEVLVLVHKQGEKVNKPSIVGGEGWAKDDFLSVQVQRSKLLLWDKNDKVNRKQGAKIISVNGNAISFGKPVEIENARIALTQKGTLNVVPEKGWQMEPIWLPAPEGVWNRLVQIVSEGYKNYSLPEHLGFSLFRVVVGFLLGALVGVPLGLSLIHI